MKSTSDRLPSSGENSTSVVYPAARATPAAASAFTWSSVIRSFFFMWMADVAMNTWMRGFSAWRTASQARSTSLNPVRERPVITGPWTDLAMASTASKSPWLAIGNPASMMSTPRRASWSAISSFSPTSREIPGDCSPSRRVVSKISTWLLITRSLSRSLGCFRATKNLPGPRAEEASASTGGCPRLRKEEAGTEGRAQILGHNAAQCSEATSLRKRIALLRHSHLPPWADGEVDQAAPRRRGDRRCPLRALAGHRRANPGEPTRVDAPALPFATHARPPRARRGGPRRTPPGSSRPTAPARCRTR